ncbi:MAG: 1-acyl-sn-glycerol-3-phosphate acyltransferase [Mongoliitalea sp.]
MKNLFNWLLRLAVKFALFLFYRNISLFGKENLPKNKAIIIVSNHQNALIDPLIVATQTHLKPHFLTRASAFKNPIANKLLRFIRMIPVYRVRDGKENMEKNNQTFDQSVSILSNHGSILIFAEGGHSHERSQRPLKKGFTRIAFQTLERFPELDLVILPLGINYTNQTQSGGKVKVFVGPEIAVKPFLNKHEELMAKTSQALQPLITQVPLWNYQNCLNYLIHQKTDLSDPALVKEVLGNQEITYAPTPTSTPYLSKKLFRLVHWPLLLLWKQVRPTINDPVFQATFKFIIGLVGYPLMFGILIYLLPSIGFQMLGYTWALLSILTVLSNKSMLE